MVSVAAGYLLSVIQSVTESQSVYIIISYRWYETTFVFVRGVQYVHLVMHKCIMVKAGRSEIHRKYVKQVKFSKTGGHF